MQRQTGQAARALPGRTKGDGDMIGSSRTPRERAQARLAQLFGGEQGEERAVIWARGVLEHNALDASGSPLRSMRALRRAESRLGLAAARYLVDAVAERPAPGGRGARRSPLMD